MYLPADSGKRLQESVRPGSCRHRQGCFKIYVTTVCTYLLTITCRVVFERWVVRQTLFDSDPNESNQNQVAPKMQNCLESDLNHAE